MSEPHLSCYPRRENRRLMLTVDGALDVITAPRAELAVRRFLADHGPRVILDASRLNFIDSRGVAVLLGAAREAREAGGAVYLYEPSDPVRRILESCRLTPLFPPPPAGLGDGAESAAAPSKAKPNGNGRPTRARSRE